MKYDDFLDRWMGQSIDWELSVATKLAPLRKMKLGVATTGMNLKVLKPIVELISVYVVNNLIRVKFTTKKFLHNQSVFQNISRSYFNIPFAINSSTLPVIMIRPSHKSSLAVIGTKLTPPAPIVSKFFATFHALKLTLPRLIVTTSRASSFLRIRPSVLARWSLVFSSTYVTNVFHQFNNTLNSVRSQYYGL